MRPWSPALFCGIHCAFENPAPQVREPIQFNFSLGACKDFTDLTRPWNPLNAERPDALDRGI